MIPISRRLVVRQYNRLLSRPRVAVGDVITCRDFSSGVQLPSKLIVAMPRSWAECYVYVQAGNAKHADDASRASAPFLVVSTVLTEGIGPDDVAPGNHRLSREVSAGG
jgi:hypothetical protein